MKTKVHLITGEEITPAEWEKRQRTAHLRMGLADTRTLPTARLGLPDPAVVHPPFVPAPKHDAPLWVFMVYSALLRLDTPKAAWTLRPFLPYVLQGRVILNRDYHLLGMPWHGNGEDEVLWLVPKDWRRECIRNHFVDDGGWLFNDGCPPWGTVPFLKNYWHRTYAILKPWIRAA